MSIVRWFMRLAASLLLVAACGDRSSAPTAPDPPSPPSGASTPVPHAITIVSGNGQEGRANEWMPAPLVLQVTDSAGAPIPNVDVQWVVTEGRGLIRVELPVSTSDSVRNRTWSDGRASVTVVPRAVGRMVVTARATGLPTDAVSFTLHAMVYVITNEWDWGGEYGDVLVSPGTPVEWVNSFPAPVHIRSYSAPAGGASFDVTLGEKERFRLVPETTGTWEWEWSYLPDGAFGGVAMLTAGDEPRSLSDSGTATAVRYSYMARFREPVPRPAIFNEAESVSCSGSGHLMTTAYLPTGAQGARRLLALYRSRDGRSDVVTDAGGTSYELVRPVIPAGRFSVLTILLEHPETVAPETAQLLGAAQHGINRQHADFASSRGFLSPIVQFEFTTWVVAPELLPDPRSRHGVINGMHALGENVLPFDFVVVINPDPAELEGGMATLTSHKPHFVYLGNYGPWRTRLTEQNLQSIAAAAYHHEIAHHWGWRHDWTPRCTGEWSYAPFVAAPVLFGWEDTDGDGIPEILDPTPYGRP